MRNIQIAEETYRYLQSKAIPFEEQPDDTIRRLLGIKGEIADNHSKAANSNDSKATEASIGGENKNEGSNTTTRQALRHFYSNIVEKEDSNVPVADKNTVLIDDYSNKSLERVESSNNSLEGYSNSSSAKMVDSNSMIKENSNSKMDLSSVLETNQPISLSLTGGSHKYSNISKSNNTVKGKKKPKTSLPELIKAGLLQEGERVYFQNYRGVKFSQYQVTIADGQLKWNNDRYSMSDLASKLLKDQDPKQDNDFVRGPVLWVNAAGKTIAELWDVFLSKKGV